MIVGRGRGGLTAAMRPAGSAKLSAALALCVLALAACGSRVDGAAIVAAGGSTVSFSTESLAALRDAATPRGHAPAGVQQRPVAEELPGAASVAAEAPAAPAAKASRPRTGPLAAAVQGAAPPSATTAAPCPRQLETINLGHIGLFSGVAAALTASAVTTMAAWAKDVNARGGLACHPVRVFTRDDGGDPSRSAALAQDLVERAKVAAFVGTFVLNPAGFVPVVERLKVPAVGGGGGHPSWYRSPMLFPEGAAVDDQIVGFLKAGVERGKKKLGVLYCVEASACTDAMDRIRKGSAKEAGAELVYDAPISVTQPDYTAQCLNARNAGVDQLLAGMDGASTTRLVRSCAAVGYRPLISTISALISPGNSRDPNLRAFGVVTAASVAPWTQRDLPGLRDYHQLLERWAPTVAPDGASILTYAAARLFEAALAGVADQARREPVTPQLVLAGLGTIKRETLGGLIGPITFTPGQQHATSNRCVFYQYLGLDGWTAPRGSKPVCLPK